MMALASPAAPRVSIVEIADHSESLAAVEREAISGARPSRVREFSTGRWLVKRLLVELGEEPQPIPIGLNRAPVWPLGIVGSISHGAGFCVAALARRTDFSSLGIDIEPHRSVESTLWEEICTADELRWLHSHSAAAELGTVLFSAKESIYKAVHPLIGTALEFQDIEIRIDPRCQTFSFEILYPAGSRFAGLSGQYRELAEGVVTALSIPADE